jgi:ubiquinone/menaquinone biosynthesis C-methylase UbiE
MPPENDPSPLLTFAVGYQISQALFVAIDLGLFTLLESRPLGLAELARRSGADKGSVKRLLGSLISLGLLVEDGQGYRNTELSSRYLVDGKDTYLGHVFHYLANLWHCWADLKHCVVSGKAAEPRAHQINDYPHRLSDFLLGMHGLAQARMDKLLEHVHPALFTRLLDVGGGLGTYSVAFAKKNPNLVSTVLDLQPTLSHTERFIEEEGVQDRVGTYSCQCTEDLFPPGPFDAVLISNLLHLYPSRDVLRILEKSWQVLEEGGLLMVHDYFHEETYSVQVGLFDLTMLVGTPEGKCHSRKDMKRWLEELGATEVAYSPITLGTSLFCCQKQTGERA